MKYQKIINKLIALGFTQESIAKAVGCAKSTLNDIKTGVTQNPRSDIADNLRAMHWHQVRNKPSQPAAMKAKKSSTKEPK